MVTSSFVVAALSQYFFGIDGNKSMTLGLLLIISFKLYEGKS